MPKEETFRLRVTSQFKREIEECAKALGESSSTLARIALREYMQRHNGEQPTPTILAETVAPYQIEPKTTGIYIRPRRKRQPKP